MATFKCPDCKKKISTEAKSCPKCGREIKPEDLPKPPKPMPKGVKIVLLAILCLIVVVAFKGQSPEDKARRALERYEAYTMGDYCKDPDSGKAILDKFMADNSVPADERTQMAACLSTKAHTKGRAIKASQALEECNVDRQQNPKKYKAYFSLEPFYSHFASTERIGAAYLPLNMAVRESLLVPDSFKHVGTMCELELDRKPPSALLSMNYKCKNAFGVELPGRISVRVNLLDLSFKEVKE